VLQFSCAFGDPGAFEMVRSSRVAAAKRVVKTANRKRQTRPSRAAE
jgi:hypothetical protein